MKHFLKIFFIVIFILNIFVLDYFLIFKKNTSAPSTPIINKCDCPVPACNCVAPTVAPTTAAFKTLPAKKTRTISYIPVPGPGQTLENKWADLSGTEFNLSTADYPNLKEAYFEANLKLINGNGQSFARLFDVTAGIEVWGSEVSSAGQKFSTISSGKITLRSGTHLYRVQAKSLTADTTVFNSGRIKLILEN